jgi:hypothetical protein
MRNLHLQTPDGAWVYSLKAGLNRIGRHPANDLSLSDPSVSSFQCEIVVSEAGIHLNDLGSSNGTLIEGYPAKQADLRPDQMLRLGTLELRLKEEEVQISIPTPEIQRPPTSVALADGAVSCLYHETIAAAYRCPKCEHVLCEACVRSLKLAGSNARLFCPSCSTLCEPLANRPGKGSKKSLLARLAQTLKLRLH